MTPDKAGARLLPKVPGDARTPCHVAAAERPRPEISRTRSAKWHRQMGKTANPSEEQDPNPSGNEGQGSYKDIHLLTHFQPARTRRREANIPRTAACSASGRDLREPHRKAVEDR